MDSKDLKYIKKHYSEKMAHLCRELFPTLLETEGLLSSVLEKAFAHSSSLAEDIISQGKQDYFKSYIYQFVDVEAPTIQEAESKTAIQLMDEAGYTLYPECQTEDDVQAFKHYYSKGEELCTFHGGRLDRCRVWFAVKKNVDQIRREDFTKPKRQDEYGTSVISIQFSRGDKNWLSIKNRYNHTVNNPDSTFNNNLDNIIPGLSEAFARDYGFRLDNNQQKGFELDNYVLGPDGKYYRYNLEIANEYYCENNYVVSLRDRKVQQFDPARYILADQFLIDMSTQTIVEYRKYSDRLQEKYRDTFVDTFGDIESISVEKDTSGNKIVRFKIIDKEDVILTIDKQNAIIGLKNPNVTNIGNNFLEYSRRLATLELPNVESVGNNFLFYNEAMTRLDLPNLSRTGESFLSWNETIEEVSLPNLTLANSGFLARNRALTRLSLPKLQYAWSCFLMDNNILSELDLPSLEDVGSNFCRDNTGLTRLSLPKLQGADDNFLMNNSSILEVYLPNLEAVNDSFMLFNTSLTELSLPKLKAVGSNFLGRNKSLSKVYLPKLKSVGTAFLLYNEGLTELSLPELTDIEAYFVSHNKSITKFDAPKLYRSDYGFISSNPNRDKWLARIHGDGHTC